jgi:hypothetical protein
MRRTRADRRLMWRKGLMLTWAALLAAMWMAEVSVSKKRAGAWSGVDEALTLFFSAPRQRRPVGRPRPTVTSPGFNWGLGITDDPTLGRTTGMPNNIADGYYALGSGTVYDVNDAAELNSVLTTIQSTSDHCVIVLNPTVGNSIASVGTKSIRRATSGCKTDIIGKPAYDRWTGADPNAFIPQRQRVTATDDLIWWERDAASGANLPLFDLGRQSGTMDKRGDGTRFIGVGFRQGTGVTQNNSYFAFLGSPDASQNLTTEEPEGIYMIQCYADGGNGENRGGICVSCRDSAFQDCGFEHWWARNTGPVANADVQALVCLNSSGGLYFENCAFESTGECWFMWSSRIQDPRNVVQRRCKFWKDRTWLQGQLTALGYTESQVTTKNDWELKHGREIIVEDCVFDTSYDVSGGGQSGASIVPKLQADASPGYDPTSRDILFRGCKMTNFQIGVWPNGFDNSTDPSQLIADRLTEVHFIDNEFTVWTGAPFGSPRIILITTMLGVFHFRHNTVYAASSLSDGKVIFFSNTLDGTAGNACDELVFEDNITPWGEDGTNGGISGAGNGSAALALGCVTYSVTRNHFKRGVAGTPAGYPSGNFYYQNWTDIMDSADIASETWRPLAALPLAADGWPAGLSDIAHHRSRLTGVA